MPMHCGSPSPDFNILRRWIMGTKRTSFATRSSSRSLPESKPRRSKHAKILPGMRPRSKCWRRGTIMFQQLGKLAESSFSMPSENARSSIGCQPVTVWATRPLVNVRLEAGERLAPRTGTSGAISCAAQAAGISVALALPV